MVHSAIHTRNSREDQTAERNKQAVKNKDFRKKKKRRGGRRKDKEQRNQL